MKLTISERIEFAVLNAELVAKGLFKGSEAMHSWEYYVRFLEIETKKLGCWPNLRWRDGWRPE